MSLREGETYASRLRTELHRAGLPSDSKQVIGRLYRFGCEHGSHHHILVGSILAIKISDEASLELHVSNPTFSSAPLISIMHHSNGWMAHVDIKPPVRSEAELDRMSGEAHERMLDADIRARFFDGEFQLL